jgi:hypothetical protein
MRMDVPHVNAELQSPGLDMEVSCEREGVSVGHKHAGGKQENAQG